MTSRNLHQIVRDAQEEFKEWYTENGPTDEPHDAIFEITDSSVPIYTSDILRLASENLDLATGEPELGPAFDGSPTPVNIIASNIFSHIEHAVWKHYEEIKDSSFAECEDCGNDIPLGKTLCNGCKECEYVETESAYHKKTYPKSETERKAERETE